MIGESTKERLAAKKKEEEDAEDQRVALERRLAKQEAAYCLRHQQETAFGTSRRPPKSTMRFVAAYLARHHPMLTDQVD